MRVYLESDNNFKKRKNPKDSRRVDYYMHENKRCFWVSKERLKELIKVGRVENAMLQGENIKPISITTHLENLTDLNYMDVVRFAATESNKLKEYDYPNYLLDIILENHQQNRGHGLLKDIFVAMRGNRVLGLYTYSKKKNYTLIYESFFISSNLNNENNELRKYKKDFVLSLSKKIKNSIFYFGDDCSYLDGTSLKIMNCKCSFKPENSYCLYSGIYMTEYNENYFVEEIEKTLFPPISLADVQVKTCKKEELSAYFSRFQKDYSEWQYYWVNANNSHSATGYVYFSNSDLRDTKEDCLFLVAYAKGVIVGVLKLSMWNNLRVIEYIDISEKYKRMGIMTLLVKQIDKLVPQEDYLLTSMESKLGREIHITDYVKKLINSRKVLTRDEYNELRYAKFNDNQKR